MTPSELIDSDLLEELRVNSKNILIGHNNDDYILFKNETSYFKRILIQSQLSKEDFTYTNEDTNRETYAITRMVNNLEGDELGELYTSLKKIATNLDSKIISLEDARKAEIKERERAKILLANLSHEFKTPLGITSGYLEMIEDGINVEKNDEYFKTINDEIIR